MLALAVEVWRLIAWDFKVIPLGEEKNRDDQLWHSYPQALMILPQVVFLAALY